MDALHPISREMGPDIQAGGVRLKPFMETQAVLHLEKAALLRLAVRDRLDRTQRTSEWTTPGMPITHGSPSSLAHTPQPVGADRSRKAPRYPGLWACATMTERSGHTLGGGGGLERQKRPCPNGEQTESPARCQPGESDSGGLSNPQPTRYLQTGESPDRSCRPLARGRRCGHSSAPADAPDRPGPPPARPLKTGSPAWFAWLRAPRVPRPVDREVV